MSHNFKHGDLVNFKLHEHEWGTRDHQKGTYKVRGDLAVDEGGDYIKLDDPTIDVKLASEETPEDNVNNPSHYGQGNIEAIDYIEDFLTDEEYIGYLRGNIGKYMHRWRYKNGLEDLKKANWYLDRLMWKMENKK